MIITFPGFVDLQVNGFAGVDYNAPSGSTEALVRSFDAMQATGVTRCLPTLITSSLARFSAAAKPLLECSHPIIAGIHMEGPYISRVDGPRGAHPAAHVCDASIEDFKRRQDAAGGRIVLVTLAPEVPGALALIEYLLGENVCVGIGHTAATGEQIRDAVAAGASLSTHLGNGCAQMLHRHNNIIWEQLAADDLCASLIADGHHLPDAMLRSMVRAKGLNSCLLVTDAIAAAAAPPGRYWIGELEVELGADGRVGQPGTPNLAGAALTMPVAVAQTVRACGLPIEKVLPLGTTQPAHYLGIEPAGLVTAEWDAPGVALTITNVAL
jgi:N-acetylglucosamine-6-phosphate deacetylase